MESTLNFLTNQKSIDIFENIIMKCCKINKIHISQIENKKEIINEYKNILCLFRSQYSIFLTDKFFSWRKRLILRYLKRYNIVYLNFNYRTDILSIIECINKIIVIYYKFIESIKKNNIDDDNDIFIKEYNKGKILDEYYQQDNYSDIYELNEYKKNLITYKLIYDLTHILNIKKIKIIRFSENIIEPSTLYKKISFSTEELYFPFENYIVKKREYKLRTLCQIAEKLGATYIKINSDVNTETTTNVSVAGESNNVSTGMKIKNKNNKLDSINLEFKYTNFASSLNLNKYYINKLVNDESEFMITKEEFYSDIDFKFLIDARCINLIQTYNTKIIINHFNELERKLFIKAQGFGINVNYSHSIYNSDTLNIEITFTDIYAKDNLNYMTGGNLYIVKEGFWHLTNIMQKKFVDILDNIEKNKGELKTHENITVELVHNNILNVYNKIDNFLLSQLYFSNKHYCDIVQNQNNNINLMNIYNDIIVLNFKNDKFINSDNIIYDKKIDDKKKDKIKQEVAFLNMKTYIQNNTYDYLLYIYFSNNSNKNLTYDKFKNFRDILIYGNDNIFKDIDHDLINKYYFISSQYHCIIKLHDLLLSQIKKYIEIHCSKILSELTTLLNINTTTTNIDNDPITRISYVIDVNLYFIIDIIYNAFVTYISQYSFMRFGNKHIEITNRLQKIAKHKNNLIDIERDISQILYEIEQILYTDFDNKFFEIIIKIKKHLCDIKTYNLDTINENFIKCLFKNVLKNIIIDIIFIYNQENRTIYCKRYVIEEFVLTTMIKYFEYKNYDENIINNLLNRKYLHNILENNNDDFIKLSKESIIKNYNDYKIYYTWKNFLDFAESYYQKCKEDIKHVMINTSPETTNTINSLSYILEIDKNTVNMKNITSQTSRLSLNNVDKDNLDTTTKSITTKLNKIKKIMRINSNNKDTNKDSNKDNNGIIKYSQCLLDQIKQQKNDTISENSEESIDQSSENKDNSIIV